MAEDFIGRGWQFPIRINAKGGFNWSEGPDRIRQAVWLIIATSLGERMMRPTFGAGANDYVFQPNSPALQTGLCNAVKQALSRWEPRITVDAVTAATDPDESSQVLISVQYTIRTTNQTFNMVYPFYLQEGTG